MVRAGDALSVFSFAIRVGRSFLTTNYVYRWLAWATGRTVWITAWVCTSDDNEDSNREKNENTTRTIIM